MSLVGSNTGASYIPDALCLCFRRDDQSPYDLAIFDGYQHALLMPRCVEEGVVVILGETVILLLTGIIGTAQDFLHVGNGCPSVADAVDGIPYRIIVQAEIIQRHLHVETVTCSP